MAKATAKPAAAKTKTAKGTTVAKRAKSTTGTQSPKFPKTPTTSTSKTKKGGSKK